MAIFGVDHGLRKVAPYHQKVTTYVKGRWYNHTVLDILVSEFKVKSHEQYYQDIQNGLISVERSGSSIKYPDVLQVKLQNKDKIQSYIHKHEPPVAYCDRIPIIHQDDEVIVIDKPAGIPVHPTGPYQRNTITELLKSQESIQTTLHPCFRLDKQTSGILVLAKTQAAASEIQRLIEYKGVSKTYLARVQGEFPDSLRLNHPVLNIDTKKGYTNGIIQRDAVTEFTRIKYDKTHNQSIVSCQPLTGRTHQIRIHLSILGHGIVNDPLYGPKASPLRKQLIAKNAITQEEFKMLLDEDSSTIANLEVTSRCEICSRPIFRDPAVKSLKIWLHAYKYAANDASWYYETDTPDWCSM